MVVLLQERARQLNPANAKRKRRLVSGMREVHKAARSGKAKAIIIAPNVASIVSPEDGAPEECPVTGILAAARDKGVPIVFALSRQRLGKVMGSRKSASAFALLDVSGAEGEVAKMMQAAGEGQRNWEEWKSTKNIKE